MIHGSLNDKSSVITLAANDFSKFCVLLFVTLLLSVSSPHTAVMILLCPWLAALCRDESEYSSRWHIGPPLSDTAFWNCARNS